MKKIKSLLLSLWTSHLFIVIKMALVFYVGKYLFCVTNHGNFDWKEEFWLTLGFTFLFYLIYTIAVCLDINRAKSSPLFLAHEIQKDIKEHLFNCFQTKKGSKGLFKSNIKFSNEDKTITYIYKPITNPQEIINKIDAFILVLYTINTHSSDEMIEKLELYRNEARYMIENKVDEIHEMSS